MYNYGTAMCTLPSLTRVMQNEVTTSLSLGKVLGVINMFAGAFPFSLRGFAALICEAKQMCHSMAAIFAFRRDT